MGNLMAANSMTINNNILVCSKFYREPQVAALSLDLWDKWHRTMPFMIFGLPSKCDWRIIVQCDWRILLSSVG